MSLDRLRSLKITVDVETSGAMPQRYEFGDVETFLEWSRTEPVIAERTIHEDEKFPALCLEVDARAVADERGA